MSTIIEFGGGMATLEGDALVTDVIKDKTFYNTDAQAIQTGTLELTGNASAGDVIKNKTFYNTDPKNQITGALELTGNAVESQVLAGQTFYKNDPTLKLTGTMVDRGAISTSIGMGGSYTIPAGYHNGSGKVTGPTTSGTYTASSRSASIDMGATNVYRYVNTNSVPNSNSGTYTYAANSTGGTVDLGTTNTYRYVNAGNVYSKGVADGKAANLNGAKGNQYSNSGSCTMNISATAPANGYVVAVCVWGTNWEYSGPTFKVGSTAISANSTQNNGAQRNTIYLARVTKGQVCNLAYTSKNGGNTAYGDIVFVYH